MILNPPLCYASLRAHFVKYPFLSFMLHSWRCFLDATSSSPSEDLFFETDAEAGLPTDLEKSSNTDAKSTSIALGRELPVDSDGD